VTTGGTSSFPFIVAAAWRSVFVRAAAWCGSEKTPSRPTVRNTARNVRDLIATLPSSGELATW
jgi:hypothetical protein